MIDFVLDASAVLAFLWKEPGWQRVSDVLSAGGSALGAVNAAEVGSKVSDRGMPDDKIETVLHSLDVEIVPFDAAQAVLASLLRARTRVLGLSLGDRACLALGQARNAVVLTADRSWTTLDLGIRIECIRPDA
jgi:PIN domain nuclease of toxin-antitoxin system